MSDRDERIKGIIADLESVGDLSADEWNALSRSLRALSPVKMPCSMVEWHPVERLRPNDYNPNSVPAKELSLLKTSVMADGYTMGIVTQCSDEDEDYFDIVDGFHRYTVGHDDEVQERTGGLVPIAIIESDRNDRMASTVRHNRARGSHAVNGMAGIVYQMLENGWGDERICAEMGMTADELVRIKHTSGFSKLFEDVEYSRSWIRASSRIKLNEARRMKSASRSRRDARLERKKSKQAAQEASE